MRLENWKTKLLKDKSNFSLVSVRREFNESLSVEFDSSLLNPAKTSFIQRINHPSRTRTLQINSIPIYPPLECEHNDCFDLADFIGFIIPGPEYSIPNYVGFPSGDTEHKVGGTVTFVCNEHLSKLIGEFMEYRNEN